MRRICAALICSLIISSLPTPLAAQDAPPFRIRVVEGEGAINNIKQPVNRAVTVAVEDQNHTPLSGVTVSFFLPNDGPSGLFPNGSRMMTAFTDDKGLASSRTVRFNNQVGLMPIRAVASLFSQEVSATITQTNVGSSSGVRSSYVGAIGSPKINTGGGGGPHISKKVWIIVGVLAAGAGAGYYFSTRKKSPQATISVGSPTVVVP